MERKMIMATEQDREAVLKLYRAQIGREFCPWDEHYPGDGEITYDLSRDALYPALPRNYTKVPV